MKRLGCWLFGTLACVLTVMAADRFDTWLWAYAFAFSAALAFALASIDDELARERFAPPEPSADRLSLRAVRLVALTHIAVGLMDARFGLTGLPDVARAAGVVGFFGGFVFVAHAMRANRFFSAVVRIQKDRGHAVVSDGPYGFVRHPGYLGMMIAVPSSGLALGSWPATAIGLAYAGLILRRVFFEDAFLRAKLPGYQQYAAGVRYRLLPGVW